jgi:hypothetical protein
MFNLFQECVDKSKLHPNFTALLGEDNSIARDYINQWADGFIDRDGKIVKEFQTTFNSTFWELYLFSVFKKWSFAIDFTHQSPDFNITSPFTVAVEAVIANNAITEQAEWQREYSKPNEPDEMAKIIYTSTLRLSNALITKRKKFKSEYSSLRHIIGKPFILAVAPFDQPFFWEQTQQAINQVLYGYKKPIYKDNDEKNERIILGHEYIDFIIKDNGAEIPLGFFSNNLMPEISAIIFSNVATVGKVRAMTKDIDKSEMFFIFSKFNRDGLHPFEGMLPKKQYYEGLEDGLGILLNPYAIHPVDEKFIEMFPNYTIWDTEMRCPIGDAKNCDLYKRMVQIFQFMDSANL